MSNYKFISANTNTHNRRDFKGNIFKQLVYNDRIINFSELFKDMK